MSCLAKTPTTDHFEIANNELVFRLSGRVKIHHGAALHRFIKGGLIQNAIHQLKYRNRPDIGMTLGNKFAEKLLSSPYFIKPDYVIPVPCHSVRQLERGYNQSEKFASGIAEVIDAKLSERHLLKVKEIASQTMKNRMDRFDNVLQSFVLKNELELRDKTILLVDDVMTTGATIEAAYTLLNSVPGITIQIGLIVLADG